MLHELAQPFLTPTINLYIGSEDYLKFLKNLKWYLEQELMEIETEEAFPVGMLGDIKIFFMHYSTFDEAKKKWEKRAKRVNVNNLYIIMVEKADCTEALIKEFDALPYSNKVIFTSREMKEIKSAYYIPESEIRKGVVSDICRYKSKFSGRRWFDDYDYVNFFNQD